MKPIVIFGVGEFADQVFYYFKKESPYEVVAFTVESTYIKEEKFHGLPVLPFESIEIDFPSTHYDMFIAVGYNNLNRVREKFFLEAKQKGYKLVNYVHPSAFLAQNFLMGENCYLLQRISALPNSRIGNGVILHTDSGMAHDCYIGDFCFFSAGCCISANVSFGPYCFVSINTTFKPGIKIGHSVIIGAGSLILENAPDESVYIEQGTPRMNRSSKFYKKFI
ncbi:MAG TPA: acetyltransferase [Oligoflexia bacterium]|nr:acetyltransferase [Oligoflexia bacterium]HMP48354.1 acetyltransferase [Oligoflexia bacterium]